MGGLERLGASHKTGMEVTCAISGCANKFIKQNPKHKYCKGCASTRQRNRNIAARKKQGKEPYNFCKGVE